MFNIFALADLFWGCRFFARFYNHICVEKQWGTISENGVMIVWLWRKNNAKLVSLSEYFKCINVLLLLFFFHEWMEKSCKYIDVDRVYVSLCIKCSYQPNNSDYQLNGQFSVWSEHIKFKMYTLKIDKHVWKKGDDLMSNKSDSITVLIVFRRAQSVSKLSLLILVWCTCM